MKAIYAAVLVLFIAGCATSNSTIDALPSANVYVGEKAPGFYYACKTKEPLIEVFELLRDEKEVTDKVVQRMNMFVVTRLCGTGNGMVVKSIERDPFIDIPEEGVKIYLAVVEAEPTGHRFYVGVPVYE